MARFHNKQGISQIEIEKVIHNYCPLGNDWYTNYLTISFEPNETIPDYIEVEEELNKLEGQTLVIEDVVDKVFSIFEEYKPKYICVRSNVNDATHFNVVVTKEKEL